VAITFTAVFPLPRPCIGSICLRQVFSRTFPDAGARQVLMGQRAEATSGSCFGPVAQASLFAPPKAFAFPQATWPCGCWHKQGRLCHATLDVHRP
jgi:hypothetical protein